MEPYYQDDLVTLYHGDYRDILPSVVADNSIDMIWTDPPYGNRNLDGDLASARVGVKGGRQRRAVAIRNDAPEEYEPLMRQFAGDAARVLKSESAVCCCCCGGGPTPAFARLALWLDEYLSFFHAVVWDKRARGHGLGWRFRRDYEFIMVAHPRRGKLAWADAKVAVPNIQDVRPVANDLHPTTKPVALVERFIQWHTSPGHVVLDPFCGSGTTLVAAKNLSRRAIGFEIEERYCDVAATRLSQSVLCMGGIV